MQGGAGNRTKLIAAGLGGLVIGGAGVALASGDGPLASDRAQVERIVREYVLAHPEIIPEAMQRLQDGKLAEVVDQNRAGFETPFGSAWAGAENGDVVLVEFFDYACGYCRKSNADIDRLLREDKQLKVVWRELPVLGPNSEAAAQMSLAAASQGRFQEFYRQMFEIGRPTPDAIARVEGVLGLGPRPATPEFRAELDKNFQLARAVNATGTPTFVVGDKVLQGAVGYDALKQAIAEARAAG
jgi:protein-disulfide isomerase